jgi:small-conductance mechanosensitive channel
MFDVDKWRSWPLFSNSLTAWFIAGSITVGVFALLLVLLRPLVRRYAKRLRATDRTEILEVPMEVLSRTTTLFFIVISIYAGAQALELGPRLTRMLNSLVTIALFWQLGLWFATAVGEFLERRRRHNLAENREALGSLTIIKFLASVVIWMLVLLATLDNLGVNITALVAGLGIGGVAVALALQNVLGDLFASLSIALDRPFVIGDFLQVDTFLGSVENIGIKTTRLRSLDGEQIIISNSNLLTSRVRNFGRMRERRVVFATSVGYETPIELIERIPVMLREIVEAEKDTRFDRSHFQKHGVASIDFETVYFVTTADFNRYMDIQQAINLKIHRGFHELGIWFASATQPKLLMPGERKPDEPKPAQPAPPADVPPPNDGPRTVPPSK